MGKMGKWCMVLVLIFSVFIISGCGKEKFSELSDSDRETMLMGMAKTKITEHLKAPATAKFPSDSKKFIFQKGKDAGVYLVGSYVDSQNGFGAMIRSTYAIKLQVIDEPSSNGDYSYRVLNYKISSN